MKAGAPKAGLAFGIPPRIVTPDTELGDTSLLIKVDNHTENKLKPAKNPKSYYLRYGIVEQLPIVLESGSSDTSNPINAAKIAVEKNYSDGISGVIAYDGVDGGTMGRMVLYFVVPQSDSEDNLFRVRAQFQ